MISRTTDTTTIWHQVQLTARQHGLVASTSWHEKGCVRGNFRRQKNGCMVGGVVGSVLIEATGTIKARGELEEILRPEKKSAA
jgi:hypothetical protein